MLKNNDSPLFQRRRPSHSLLKEDDGNKQSILLNNKKFNEKTPLLPHLTSHLRTATNSDGHEDNHNHQHSLSKIFSTATTPSPSTPTKSFTRSQVRNLARNNPEQVWVIYQDLVLNLTKWIKYHPGGDLPLRHLSGTFALAS